MVSRPRGGFESDGEEVVAGDEEEGAEGSVDGAEVDESSSAESLLVRSAKTWFSRAWRRLSSSWTRAWMCSSRALARVESFCGLVG
jgi:hypothetical protein